MGNASCTSMSTISSSDGVCHSRQILPYHDQMGLASASTPETDRGRSPTDQSLEPEGEIPTTQSSQSPLANSVK